MLSIIDLIDFFTLRRLSSTLTWHTVAIGGAAKVLVVALIIRRAREAKRRIVKLCRCGRGARGESAAGQVRRIGGGCRPIAPVCVAGT